MNNLTTGPEISQKLMADVLVMKNTKNLSAEQKVSYLQALCGSLGLNPLTSPFEFMNLGGKEVVYARRDATDQLRKIYKVSVRITAKETIEGIHIVTAEASTPDGRVDASTGAVNIQGLKGEALANALMKAETKAKRRATLSICGLGFLDETETETIQGSSTYIPTKTVLAIAEQAHQQATQEPEAKAIAHAEATREGNKPKFTDVPEDAGEYRVKFGKKFKDQKLKAIDHFEMDSFITWCFKECEKKGAAPSPEVEELSHNFERYLEQYNLLPAEGN